MKAAIVRVKESKLLVGFYVYRNNTELSSFIDEICDPDDCEYKAITTGGISWEGPDDGVELTEFDEEAEYLETNDLPGATFNHQLSSAAYDQSNWICCSKLYA